MYEARSGSEKRNLRKSVENSRESVDKKGLHNYNIVVHDWRDRLVAGCIARYAHAGRGFFFYTS